MAGDEIPLSPLTGRPMRPPGPPPQPSPSPTPPTPGGSLYLDSNAPGFVVQPTAYVPPPGGLSPGGVTRSVAEGDAGGVVTGPSSLGVVAGRYELEKELGEGGMGAVYKCFDRHVKRDAALKRILPQKRDARKDTRFMHEARAMARLQHPGCVQIYDV